MRDRGPGNGIADYIQAGSAEDLAQTGGCKVGLGRELPLDGMLHRLLQRCVARTSRGLSALSDARAAEWPASWEDWNRLCDDGRVVEAFRALEGLARRGSSVSENHLHRLLQACMARRDLATGREVHRLIVRCGFEPQCFLGNQLIQMYASHNRLAEASGVFSRLPAPNQHVWCSIIRAHAELGQPEQAIRMYERFRASGGRVNEWILVAVLKACAGARDVRKGRWVHEHAVAVGCVGSPFVGSSLIDMYARCGSLGDAQGVFEGLCSGSSSVVLWTAMLGAYVQHGCGREALELYEKMVGRGIARDRIVMVCLLKACGVAGAVEQGASLHQEIVDMGLERSALVGNALVYMYASLGLLDTARRVFSKVVKRNAFTWTALMNGYGQYGDLAGAVECFEQMGRYRVKPDATTFACLLAACSRAGALDDGEKYFKMMEAAEYAVVPAVEHFNCMADLYAQAGRLDDAEKLLLKAGLPEANTVGWRSLLYACFSLKNVELARRCFDRIYHLDPTDPAPYVIMASAYADVESWADVDNIKLLQKSVGAVRKRSKAVIEVAKKVHEFSGDDHNFSPTVHAKLQSLNAQAEEEQGSLSQSPLAWKPLQDDETEDVLCGHAEKLAIAFGLLHTLVGAPLHVVKNLRMCKDCHRFCSIISRMERRKITVRDVHRVHVFNHGT